MKIAIIGTGGVGGYFGGKIARAGYDVTFLSRGEHLKAIQQNGTVIKLAEKYTVETPVNRFVYNCLLPMEIKARSGSVN
jgi:ketopantoate reductase